MFHKRHFKRAGVCIICISSEKGSRFADLVFSVFSAALLQLQSELKKQTEVSQKKIISFSIPLCT